MKIVIFLAMVCSLAWPAVVSRDFVDNIHTFGGDSHSSDTLSNVNGKISDATLIDTADSRLSDSRTPTAHALGGAEHSSDTLANLNGKVSDATLIDTADSRLSDERSSNAIATTGADVNVDLAAPPTTGQVLEATSATTATWQTPAAGGAPVTVEDEGVPLTTGVTLFDFAGAGVTVTEPVTDEVLVTISGNVAHAASHIDGGSDVIDADKAEISWVPANYTRDSTTPSEADSDDDLTAHLQGLDNVIGMIATEIFSDTLQTTDATVTTIRTVGIADNFVENIDFDCVAIKSDGTKGSGRQIKGTFRNPNGASNVVGIGAVTTIYSKVDTPNSYTTAMTISTDDVLLQITGHTAETVEWRCKTEIISRDGTP